MIFFLKIFWISVTDQDLIKIIIGEKKEEMKVKKERN